MLLYIVIFKCHAIWLMGEDPTHWGQYQYSLDEFRLYKKQSYACHWEDNRQHSSKTSATVFVFKFLPCLSSCFDFSPWWTVILGNQALLSLPFPNYWRSWWFHRIRKLWDFLNIWKIIMKPQLWWYTSLTPTMDSRRKKQVIYICEHSSGHRETEGAEVQT